VELHGEGLIYKGGCRGGAPASVVSYRAGSGEETPPAP
jgi:hypothetical protein